MSTMVEDPATIRELTRYVEHEHPDLDTSYNARCEQLVVVGQPGKPEPPAALREVIATSDFELRARAVASRGRWVGCRERRRRWRKPMSADAQPSTFGCAFCPFEDDPQAVKAHLIDEHAADIADQHWATHIYRITEETDP